MKSLFVIAPLLAVLGLSAGAQTEPGMGFFVTSTDSGDGGNLEGLAGADAHCQKLATAAGAGAKTWRTYLSTNGDGAVNARDRIGPGPWHNALGVLITSDLQQLHGDNAMDQTTALTENGHRVPGRPEGCTNVHDILTGSDQKGLALEGDASDNTCKNWTSSSGWDKAKVGHHDRLNQDNTVGASWNSAHHTRGCSKGALGTTGGVGLFYCFAVGAQ